MRSRSTPRPPATLYVSTGGGVFKSTDGGGNWRSVLVLSPGTFVLALAIDPQTPMTVYAGTIDATTTGSGHGVFKSTDGGESWSAVNTGLSNQAVHALAVDPQTPTTVYAGTQGGGVGQGADGEARWGAVL